jgi:hypothetical protein
MWSENKSKNFQFNVVKNEKVGVIINRGSLLFNNHSHEFNMLQIIRLRKPEGKERETTIFQGYYKISKQVF